MAAIATLAWPRILTASTLLGLTLLGGHEAPREEPAQVVIKRVAKPTSVRDVMIIVPEPLSDACAWPRGMVIAPPETGDHMAIGVVATTSRAQAPLVALLSGLCELLGSRGA